MPRRSSSSSSSSSSNNNNSSRDVEMNPIIASANGGDGNTGNRTPDSNSSHGNTRNQTADSKRRYQWYQVMLAFAGHSFPKSPWYICTLQVVGALGQVWQLGQYSNQIKVDVKHWAHHPIRPEEEANYQTADVLWLLQTMAVYCFLLYMTRYSKENCFPYPGRCGGAATSSCEALNFWNYAYTNAPDQDLKGLEQPRGLKDIMETPHPGLSRIENRKPKTELPRWILIMVVSMLPTLLSATIQASTSCVGECTKLYGGFKPKTQAYAFFLNLAGNYPVSVSFVITFLYAIEFKNDMDIMKIKVKNDMENMQLTDDTDTLKEIVDKIKKYEEEKNPKILMLNLCFILPNAANWLFYVLSMIVWLENDMDFVHWIIYDSLTIFSGMCFLGITIMAPTIHSSDMNAFIGELDDEWCTMKTGTDILGWLRNKDFGWSIMKVKISPKLMGRVAYVLAGLGLSLLARNI